VRADGTLERDGAPLPVSGQSLSDVRLDTVEQISKPRLRDDVHPVLLWLAQLPVPRISTGQAFMCAVLLGVASAALRFLETQLCRGAAAAPAASESAAEPAVSETAARVDADGGDAVRRRPRGAVATPEQ